MKQTKESSLNILIALSFSANIHNMLSEGYYNSDRDTVLSIALAVKSTADRTIKLFNSVSSEQIRFCFRKIEKIRKKHWTQPQDITVFINFCMAILEDCQRWDKIPSEARQGVDDVANLLVSLLLCFDPDYSDNTAAELAISAFKTWKVVKF